MAALLTQWLAERNLRAFRLYASWKKLLLGAVIGPVLVVLGFVLVPGFLMAKGSPRELNWAVFGSLAGFNWSTLLGGPLNEEPGWRGYALPKLQASFGPVFASFVLGLLWAGWHLPMFLIPGWVNVSVGLYALITIAITFLMTYGANISGFSVVVAVIMHAAYNSSSGFLAASIVVVTRGRLGSPQSSPVSADPPPRAT